MSTASTDSESPMGNVSDPHSFARPAEVAVRYLELELDVDFDARRLRGAVRWELDRRDAASRSVVLDTRGLRILEVERESDGTRERRGTREAARHTLGEPDALLGEALEIEIDAATTHVVVRYETGADAAALLWLEPEQTTSGAAPFLFTQSQAILARTWIPCQDSPGVRFAFEATVRAPAGREVLVAARRAEASEEQRASAASERLEAHRFEMPQPIPAYLLALAVGELEYRAWSSRAGVWAEPALIESAYHEFADTERMIAVAESLFGPYRWEQYDILVLPPSFPFGGMENPRLTFATPTILAGDRSLTSLIAHELAHSWSGNLVTNATWNDFWLNEGFTVYLEHRIVESVYGREYDDMLVEIGRRELEDELEELSERDTWLALDLAGRDPDEGLTSVAYEKGYLFLRHLEEAVGRDRFDPFLREYFDRHAFRSMTTDGFVAYLVARLFDGDRARADALGVGAWIHGPGLPSDAPRVESTAFRRVEASARAWLVDGVTGRLPTKDWSAHEWVHFLRVLRAESADDEERMLTIEQLTALDARFALSESSNAEILCEWLQHAVASGYSAADEALERFLTRVGRRKFLTPIYRRLMKATDGAEKARRIYTLARDGYHGLARATLDEIVGWGENSSVMSAPTRGASTTSTASPVLGDGGVSP